MTKGDLLKVKLRVMQAKLQLEKEKAENEKQRRHRERHRERHQAHGQQFNVTGGYAPYSSSHGNFSAIRNQLESDSDSTDSDEESEEQRKRKKRSRRRRRESSRNRRRERKRRAYEKQNKDHATTQRKLLEQQAIQQQQVMSNFLNDLNSQIEEHLEIKQREDFERRLEDRIKVQNQALIEEITKKNPPMHPLYHPQYYPPQPTATGDVPQQSQKHQTQQQTVQAGNKPPPKPVAQKKTVPQNLPAKPVKPQAKPRLSIKPKGSQAKKKSVPLEGEENEDRSIWERLLDEDSALLAYSDDEDEQEKKKLKEKKRLEEELKKKKAPRIIVYGNGKPLYRWIKEGEPNPPSEQILKGKELFRAIASVFVALKRMEMGSVAKRVGMLPEDIKEMEKAILWFTDKTKTWLCQVLTLPLVDMITKTDLVLDPKALSKFGNVQKLGFMSKVSMKKKKTKVTDEASAEKDMNANSQNAKLDILVLRLKVRVRGILEFIHKTFTEDKLGIPSNICAFFLRIMSDGAAFPGPYLFEHESSLLEFSEAKHTRWMLPEIKPENGDTNESNEGEAKSEEDEQPVKTMYDLKRIKVVLGGFILMRCLVPILLRPWEAGIGRKPEKRVQSNLTMVATLVYTLAQGLIGGPNAGELNPEEDKKNILGGIKLGITKGKDKDTKPKENKENKENPAPKKSKFASLFRRGKTKNSKVSATEDKTGAKESPRDSTASEEKDTDEQGKKDGEEEKQGEDEPKEDNEGEVEEKEDEEKPEEDEVEEDENKLTLEEEEERKKEAEEEEKRRYLSIYDITSHLYTQKHISGLEGKMGFMEDLKILLHKCILLLMKKVYTLADSDWTLLLEQIEEELRALDEQTVQSDKRHTLKKRENHLKKRLEEKERLQLENERYERERLELEAKRAEEQEREEQKQAEEAKALEDQENAEKQVVVESSDEEDSSEDEDEEDEDEEDEEEDEEDENENEKPKKKKSKKKKKAENVEKAEEEDHESGEESQEEAKEEPDKPDPVDEEPEAPTEVTPNDDDNGDERDSPASDNVGDAGEEAQAAEESEVAENQEQPDNPEQPAEANKEEVQPEPTTLNSSLNQ